MLRTGVAALPQVEHDGLRQRSYRQVGSSCPACETSGSCPAWAGWDNEGRLLLVQRANDPGRGGHVALRKVAGKILDHMRESRRRTAGNTCRAVLSPRRDDLGVGQ